jgi:ATP-binding cassette subfamily C (CFTR/MRP) protein 1
VTLQNWLVRSVSEVEQNIVSVERIMQYINIPPEAPYEIEGRVDDTWPSRGEIEFKEYSVRYRPELDLVLKSISIVIVSR